MIKPSLRTIAFDLRIDYGTPPAEALQGLSSGWLSVTSQSIQNSAFDNALNRQEPLREPCGQHLILVNFGRRLSLQQLVSLAKAENCRRAGWPELFALLKETVGLPDPLKANGMSLPIVALGGIFNDGIIGAKHVPTVFADGSKYQLTAPLLPDQFSEDTWFLLVRV